MPESKVFVGKKIMTAKFNCSDIGYLLRKLCTQYF